ncbi:MAG: pitrilysin family protein [Gammaproteobacteria bacterium]
MNPPLSIVVALLCILITSAADADPAIPGVSLPEYQEIKLENGARLVLMERREVPLVAFRAVLRGGAIAEPGELGGIARLTAGMLEQGAGTRDAQAFAETVAAVGGEIEVEGGLESISVSGEFLARDTDLWIGLLADMLRRPRFSETEFEKLKRRYIDAIAAAKDDDLRAFSSVYGAAYLDRGHPYGRPVSGSEESLARVAYQDMLDFYRTQIGSDRLLIVVVGDFDSASLSKKIATGLGDWRKAEGALPEITAPVQASGRQILLVDKPGASQSYFWIGNRGVSQTDPAEAAGNLVNTIFGDRFTSWLNTALRVESGLTYGARSVLRKHTLGGSLAMTSFTPTETTFEAIDLALLQLQRLHQQGFDAASLDSGKNYVRGTFPLDLETGPQLARALAGLKFFDQPDAAINDYAEAISHVSAANAAAVIERVYPDLDNLVFVVIGDGAAIREQLNSYGELDEVSISSPRFLPSAAQPAESGANGG